MTMVNISVGFVIGAILCALTISNGSYIPF